MPKESKNILTREGCQKELIRLTKGKLLHDVVLLMVMLLIFVPLAFIGLYLSKYILIFGIVTILVCAAPPLIFVYKLIYNIIKLHLVEKNKFSIVKDTISRLSKDEPMGRHTVDAIYFTLNGRYVPSKSTFDLSTVGDEFYLVILHTKKNELCFAFHTMMYECKDTQ
ncbi:MAG: hypothetical protein IJ292_00575 [Clostridia bacterium]|nr:hypothetical protein [Clostridia bacterium]